MIEETRYKETPTDVDRSRIGVSTTPTYVAEEQRTGMFSRIIAWGPIWAGVVIAFGIQVMLAVLGIAVGLSVASQTSNTGEGFGVAAGIWTIITALAALFIGGWAAAWLAGSRKPSHGAANGFVLWCTVTALSAALVTTTSSALIGGGLGALGGSMQQQQAVPGQAAQVPGTQSGTMQSVQPADVARQSAGVAWWTFVVLLLSAGAAALGGSVGFRGMGNERRRAT